MYCSLFATNILFLFYLSVMFVDIGNNVSVVDRVKLSYIYDDIDQSEVGT